MFVVDLSAWNEDGFYRNYIFWDDSVSIGFTTLSDYCIFGLKNSLLDVSMFYFVVSELSIQCKAS